MKHDEPTASNNNGKRHGRSRHIDSMKGKTKKKGADEGGRVEISARHEARELSSPSPTVYSRLKNYFIGNIVTYRLINVFRI